MVIAKVAVIEIIISDRLNPTDIFLFTPFPPFMKSGLPLRQPSNLCFTVLKHS